MAATKCPNGACSFYFDSSLVPGGAKIVCPRCQHRFTLADTETIDPFSGSPLAHDYQPTLPLGADVLNTPGPQLGATPSIPSLAFTATIPTERLAPRIEGSSLVKRIVIIAACLSLAVLLPIVYVYFTQTKSASYNDEAQRNVTVEDKNFRVLLPGNGWKKDMKLQNDLGVNVFAYTHVTNPEIGVALHTIDYNTRNPLNTELKAEALRVLNRQFLYISNDLPLEEFTWGKHKGKLATFRGETKETGATIVGEVAVLAHQGLGYWYFTWVTESQAAEFAAQLQELREGFRVLELRNQWKAQQSNEQVFQARSQGASLRLSTYDTFWKQDRDPDKEDKRAILLLNGVIKQRGQSDFNPEATVVGLVLPGDRNQAIELIRKRWIKDPDIFGPTTITELTDEPLGEATELDMKSGEREVTRWQVSTGGVTASRANEKLVLFTTMTSGDKTIVAEAYCPLRERETWERRLIAFLSTLNP